MKKKTGTKIDTKLLGKAFVKAKEDKTNPSYYKGKIETFDYLLDKMTPEEISGFCKGSVISYVTREKHKGGLEDLKKAKWFLDKLIETKEKV